MYNIGDIIKLFAAPLEFKSSKLELKVTYVGRLASINKMPYTITQLSKYEIIYPLNLTTGVLFLPAKPVVDEWNFRNFYSVECLNDYMLLVPLNKTIHAKLYEQDYTFNALLFRHVYIP